MADTRRRTEGTGLVLSLFAREDQATRALEDLLAAGFLNVERELEGDRTAVLVEPDGREAEATAILARHGGTRVDLAG